MGKRVASSEPARLSFSNLRLHSSASFSTFMRSRCLAAFTDRSVPSHLNIAAMMMVLIQTIRPGLAAGVGLGGAASRHQLFGRQTIYQHPTCTRI